MRPLGPRREDYESLTTENLQEILQFLEMFIQDYQTRRMLVYEILVERGVIKESTPNGYR